MNERMNDTSNKYGELQRVHNMDAVEALEFYFYFFVKVISYGGKCKGASYRNVFFSSSIFGLVKAEAYILNEIPVGSIVSAKKRTDACSAAFV